MQQCSKVKKHEKSWCNVKIYLNFFLNLPILVAVFFHGPHHHLLGCSTVSPAPMLRASLHTYYTLWFASSANTSIMLTYFATYAYYFPIQIYMLSNHKLLFIYSQQTVEQQHGEVVYKTSHMTLETTGQLPVTVTEVLAYGEYWLTENNLRIFYNRSCVWCMHSTKSCFIVATAFTPHEDYAKI